MPVWLSWVDLGFVAVALLSGSVTRQVARLPVQQINIELLNTHPLFSQPLAEHGEVVQQYGSGHGSLCFQSCREGAALDADFDL